MFLNLAPRDATRSGPNLRALLVGADALAAVIAWMSALASLRLRDALLWAATATLLTVVALALHRLYLARTASIRVLELQLVARAVGLTGLVLIGITGQLDIGPSWQEVLLGSGLSLALVTLGRGLYRSWLASGRRAGRYVRPVVLLGSGEDVTELHALLADHPELGYRVVGLLGPCDDAAQDSGDLPVPWLGDLDRPAEAVRSAGATGVLAAAGGTSSSRLTAAVRELVDAGLHVHVSNGLRGIARRRLRPLALAHEPLVYVEPARLTAWQLRTKRALDVLVSVGVLAVVAPALLGAAIAIRLEDRGPLLFRQRRVGLDGREFTLLKLRTMVVDAERRVDELHGANERDAGPLFKVQRDPRVTRVGRLLRATSLDELPQLFNVLSGSMSLVGPRPALPEEMHAFDAELQSRTRVPPGLTGLWQVTARDNPSFRPYRRLDLFYVENWSVALDLGILVSTASAVVTHALRHRDGALGGDQSGAVRAAHLPAERDQRDEPDEPEERADRTARAAPAHPGQSRHIRLEGDGPEARSTPPRGYPWR